MLENWCWLGDELKKHSCHYTASDPALLQEWQEQHPEQERPPTVIPDSLVNPLVSNRHAFRALYMLEQL
jgi:metallopeptidase MepB